MIKLTCKKLADASDVIILRCETTRCLSTVSRPGEGQRMLKCNLIGAFLAKKVLIQSLLNSIREDTYYTLLIHSLICVFADHTNR